MIIPCRPGVGFTPDAFAYLDTEKLNLYITHILGNLRDYVLPKEDLESAINKKVKEDFGPFCSVTLEEMVDPFGNPIGIHFLIDYALSPPSRLYH